MRRFSLRRFSLRSLRCGAFTAEPSLRTLTADLQRGTFTANSHCGSPARKLSFSASIEGKEEREVSMREGDMKSCCLCTRLPPSFPPLPPETQHQLLLFFSHTFLVTRTWTIAHFLTNLAYRRALPSDTSPKPQGPDRFLDMRARVTSRI